MTSHTIRTSAGDFTVRDTDGYLDADTVALRIARRLGHQAARLSRSGGEGTNSQISYGRRDGRGLQVAGQMTVYSWDGVRA